MGAGRRCRRSGPRPRCSWRRGGQVSMEMAVLFSFVVAALVFMGTYIQRGAQGGLKSGLDSIGPQFSTAGNWKSLKKSNQLKKFTKDDETNKITEVLTESGYCADAKYAIGGGGVGSVSCTAPEVTP